MISLVKNLKCISRLNIHYYPNRRYKSYITSLKAVIAGKSLISAGLDIDRILHFVFCDKILQIYRQHWVRKFYRHILSKYRQFSKKQGGWGYTLLIPLLDTPFRGCALIVVYCNIIRTFCDTNRSSLPEVFCKKRCFQKFRKIHRKHLCQSLIFNKVAGP